MSFLPRQCDAPEDPALASMRILPVVLAVAIAAHGLLLAAAARGNVAEQEAAAQLRRQFDLEKASAADVWLVPEEIRLLQLLRQLEPVSRNLLALQTSLDNLVRQNRLRWEANRPLLETLRRGLAGLPSNDPQRRQIEQQIRELQAQAVEPALLAEMPAARERLIRMINLRARLSLSVHQIRRLHEAMVQAYQRLSNDPEIAALLQSLGGAHRLGPLQPSYEVELRRLNKYEALVATDWLPIYRQSGRVRFGGLLDDRVPVTFTYLESEEPTLMPGSAVEAAGLAVPADAEAVPLRLPHERRVVARRMTLPSLRFAGVWLRDVSVLVLPAEAEDLGAQIGPAGFQPVQVEIQPELLRMVLRSP